MPWLPALPPNVRRWIQAFVLGLLAVGGFLLQESVNSSRDAELKRLDSSYQWSLRVAFLRTLVERGLHGGESELSQLESHLSQVEEHAVIETLDRGIRAEFLGVAATVRSFIALRSSALDRSGNPAGSRFAKELGIQKRDDGLERINRFLESYRAAHSAQSQALNDQVDIKQAGIVVLGCFALYAIFGPLLARLTAKANKLGELSGVAELTRNAIIFCDADRRVTWVNPAFTRITGYTLDEVKGKTPGSILQFEGTDDRTVEKLKNALNRGEFVRVEIQNKAKDGKLYWMDVEIQPTRDASGRVTGFIAVESEITDQILLRESLRKSEEQLRETIEGAEIAIWDWQIVQKGLTTNDRWVTMLGYEPGELVPSFDNWISLLHREDQPRTTEALEQHFAQITPEFRVEFRLRRKDGTWCWVLASGRVVERDDQGKPLRMLGIHVDISAQKEKEIRLQESEAQLASIFEAMAEGLVVHGRDGAIVSCNPKAAEILGLSQEQLLGLTSFDPRWCIRNEFGRLMTGRDHPSSVTRSTGEPLRGVKLQVDIPDGLPKWVSVNTVPIRSESGEIVSVVASFSDITEQYQQERKMWLAAHTDRLTGLGNRKYLIEEIDTFLYNNSVAHEEPYGLLFLDFDRFKVVNDSLGHESGDELLVQIARRLQSLVDEVLPAEAAIRSIAARLGGDEFVLFVQGIESTDMVRFFAQRVVEKAKEPYIIQGQTVFSSASVGLVTSDSAYTSAADLLRDADTAMYEAKFAGKACVLEFDSKMRARIENRLQIENELRTAIEGDQLELVYQPIVCLSTGHVKSFEALIRWEHPTRGRISPADFIPVAEESGLIVPLGEWILQDAIRQVSAWDHNAQEAVVPSVSINISQIQIERADLAQMIDQFCKQYSVNPARLQLEITESVMMSDPASAIKKLEAVKQLGCRIALDDFGTGYSSLSSVQDFPLDVIKVDRAFVTDLSQSTTKRNLIEAILRVAKALHIQVVAEGIETVEELDLLRSLGCEFGQGYFIGRPMPAADAQGFSFTPPIVGESAA